MFSWCNFAWAVSLLGMHEWVTKHVAYLFHYYVSWNLGILYLVSQFHFIPYTSARYSHGMSVLESFWLQFRSHRFIYQPQNER
jgi:hypothetical protein